MTDDKSSPTIKKSLRIRHDTWNRLAERADEKGVPQSGYVASLLDNVVELGDELATIKDAIEALAKAKGSHDAGPAAIGDVEAKVDALAIKVNESLEVLQEIPTAFQKLCDGFETLSDGITGLTEDAQIIAVDTESHVN